MKGRWTRGLTESQLRKASDVTAVVLPSCVTAIGGDAFYRFTALTSMRRPAECATTEDGPSWPRGAFSRCSALVAVAIPKACTSIGKEAFGWCVSLADMTIPPCCAVGDGAFLECPNVTVTRR
jgi:hypothetical protein